MEIDVQTLPGTLLQKLAFIEMKLVSKYSMILNELILERYWIACLTPTIVKISIALSIMPHDNLCIIYIT